MQTETQEGKIRLKFDYGILKVASKHFGMKQQKLHYRLHTANDPEIIEFCIQKQKEKNQKKLKAFEKYKKLKVN